MSNAVKEKFKVRDIVFLDREQVTTTISKLITVLELYGFATVTDLYEIAGLTGNYAADKWGWKSVADFKIIAVSGGYGLEYPELERKDTANIVDSKDDKLRALSDKTHLSVTVLKALFAQDYMFIEEMGKAYRFERRSL